MHCSRFQVSYWVPTACKEGGKVLQMDWLALVAGTFWVLFSSPWRHIITRVTRKKCLPWSTPSYSGKWWMIAFLCCMCLESIPGWPFARFPTVPLAPNYLTRSLDQAFNPLDPLTLKSFQPLVCPFPLHPIVPQTSGLWFLCINSGKAHILEKMWSEECFDFEDPHSLLQEAHLRLAWCGHWRSCQFCSLLS